MSLWVDGQLVIDALDFSNMPANPGYVGFECRNGNKFIIDNLNVTASVAATGYKVTGNVKADTTALASASVALKDGNGKVVARMNTALDGSYKFVNEPSPVVSPQTG